MSDEPNPPVASAGATPESPTPHSPGGWLKQERERQAITVQRVAADMHLSVAAIEAIEANRFASLGAPVFAKGHLRKYASLLGLPADRVAELYDRLDDAPRLVDPVPVTQRAPEPALRPSIREMLNPGPDSKLRRSAIWPWVAATAALTLAIAMGAWWMLARAPHRSAPATVDASTAAANTPDEPTSHQPVANSLPSTTSAPANTHSAVAPAPIATPSRPPRAASTPPPGKIRLRLAFERESWVEVYDANGNRIFYDVGRTDAPRSIDVEPPALVVLGDAAAVSAEANGKALFIPQKNISGSVARFTVAADGSVK